MARTPRHSRACGGVGQGPSGARRRHRDRAPPPDCRRGNGPTVQSASAAFAGVAGSGGVRMSDITYRDALLSDAGPIADLFARSFVDTFGHLYKKEDLDAFLAGVTAEAFAEEIGNPQFALRLAECDGEPAG